MQIFSFLYHVGTISGSAGAKEKWGFPDRPALVKKSTTWKLLQNFWELVMVESGLKKCSEKC